MLFGEFAFLCHNRKKSLNFPKTHPFWETLIFQNSIKEIFMPCVLKDKVVINRLA